MVKSRIDVLESLRKRIEETEPDMLRSLVHGVVELLMTYVENGTRFTREYGDIDERFYSSVESALDELAADGLVRKVQGKGVFVSPPAPASRFWGVVVPGSVWRPLAVAAAVVSATGIVMFFGTWPMFNTLAALGVNVAVLVAVLWLRWPSEAILGG